MVISKDMGEVFYIPISAKRVISFLGKRLIIPLVILMVNPRNILTNSFRDRLFSIYRDKRPDALRRRILDLQR
jgi:hypothetical protein